MAASQIHQLYRFQVIERDHIWNQSNDPNIGSARNGSDSTTTQDALDTMGVNTASTSGALLSTFAPTFLLSCIWIVIFIVCRRTQRRFYAPKSYLKNIPDYEKTVELPNGWLNWIKPYWSLTDTYVLQHVSLDGYFFLRFLRMVSTLCFVGALGTWPILFPIHATGGGVAQQLDKLNFSNVVNPQKYYAHVLVSWVFFGFIFYMVVRESVFYAGLRQAYFISPMAASRLSSRTVLFMSVPQSYMSKSKLRRVFGNAVSRVWIATETDKLDELVHRRDTAAYQLEFLETKLVKRANKARLEYRKKNPTEPGAIDLESGVRINRMNPFSTPWGERVAGPAQRKHIFGPKFDKIAHLRQELESLIPEVDRLQAKHKHGKARQIPAVFVEFETQGDAQLAYQTLAHHQPFTMTPRYIGITPDQVIWRALKYSWLNRLVRKFAIQGSIAMLIIFWSIPSAIVGTIANIDYLTKILPFLDWMNDLPDVIMSVISGILPAAGLAILMSFVPIILRVLARQTGVPSVAGAELFMQNANFCFQVVQVFLVTTLTSAASAAVGEIINDPLSIKDLLAKNLPKASNFYISYFLLQGLVLSTGAVVHLMGFLAYNFMRTCFDSTPRKLYQRWSSLTHLSWGTVFPTFTNMAVIAITYSCIAPLILGFASLGLFLVYHAYRYNLLFVYDCDIDTKGLIYPRALQQLLTGIYLAEVCMIGLFAIKGAVGPLVMMALSLIATSLGHIALNEALRPLLEGLPRTLDDQVEEDDQCDVADDGISIASGDGNFFQKAIRLAGRISPKTSSNLRAQAEKDKQLVTETVTACDSSQALSEDSTRLGSSTTVDCTLSDLKHGGMTPPSTSSASSRNVSVGATASRQLPELRRTQTHRLNVSPRDFFNQPRSSFSRFFEWFFKPNIYANPILLSKKVRKDNPDPYDERLINDAYFPPSVRSPHPLLWIPHDEGGFSSHEVQETTRNGIISMTDDECHLNDKNKVIWDKIGMRPPIFTEKIFY